MEIVISTLNYHKYFPIYIRLYLVNFKYFLYFIKGVLLSMSLDFNITMKFRALYTIDYSIHKSCNMLIKEEKYKT